MPELPEVETMRRGIAPVIGCRIAAVERVRCRKRPIVIRPAMPQWRARVVGQRIVGTDRLGKRVLIALETGDRILFEPRMTGLVLIDAPPTREHLRFSIALAGGRDGRLSYWDRRGLGSVRLLTADEFERLKTGGRYGPDALALTAETLRARLATSRRAIKVALLDQRALAGIGNLYASEMLHHAAIHPTRTCCDLSPEEWCRLHAAMIEILELAIRYEGSTLADGTYRNALNKAGGYQNHHRVYDKEHRTCPRCRQGTILRIVQAQRATFFCPVCQAEPRRRR
jgi:formamidopyrimidine-DNA glycosylase